MNKLIFFTLFLFSMNLTAKEKPVVPTVDGIRFSKVFSEKVKNNINLKLQNKNKLTQEEVSELQDLQTILSFGKKAIEWFEKVNMTREINQKLELSPKGTSKGMPITDPMKTNSEILLSDFQKLMLKIPHSLTEIINGENEFPSDTNGLSDEDFVKFIHQIDVIYQHTIRWASSKNSLDWFALRAMWDVRGYLGLKNLPDLEERLNHWDRLSTETALLYSNWLISLCRNGNFSLNDCDDKLTQSIKSHQVYDYFLTFNHYGEVNYNRFFSLTTKREELFWNQDNTILYSPFLSPQRSDVQKWLSQNIEDEWRGDKFQLHLSFIDESKINIPHIQFESGVTAHVNEIGGDTITMDGDYALTNYDQRWTIRHEYGHVLGFVDCYLEFYDTHEKAMIYYELDINNLMCSRHGELQAQHISALRAAY